ncbi:MAG: hypothetical protein GY711_23010 [bacterium]|nr:hypothetical protein [bacterium]
MSEEAEKGSKLTKTEKSIKRLKDHRWLSPLIVFGAAVVAIATFTKALSDLGHFIGG